MAGHQIAVNLVAMMFMLALAQATAAGTLVAQHLGAGEPEAARRVGRHALVLATLVAGVVGALAALLRQPIVALYTRDQAAAAAAVPCCSGSGSSTWAMRCRPWPPMCCAPTTWPRCPW